MPLSAGARLGSYKVESLLGAGGMGEVYRARDTRLRGDVALKILHERVRYDERGPAVTMLSSAVGGSSVGPRGSSVRATGPTWPAASARSVRPNPSVRLVAALCPR